MNESPKIINWEIVYYRNRTEREQNRMQGCENTMLDLSNFPKDK